MTLIDRVKIYPGQTGIISSAASTGSGLISLLSNEEIVRAVTCCGALFGMVLTALSIYHKWMQIRKESNGKL